MVLELSSGASSPKKHLHRWLKNVRYQNPPFLGDLLEDGCYILDWAVKGFPGVELILGRVGPSDHGLPALNPTLSGWGSGEARCGASWLQEWTTIDISGFEVDFPWRVDGRHGIVDL